MLCVRNMLHAKQLTYDSIDLDLCSLARASLQPASWFVEREQIDTGYPSTYLVNYNIVHVFQKG